MTMRLDLLLKLLVSMLTLKTNQGPLFEYFVSNSSSDKKVVTSWMASLLHPFTRDPAIWCLKETGTHLFHFEDRSEIPLRKYCSRGIHIFRFHCYIYRTDIELYSPGIAVL